MAQHAQQYPRSNHTARSIGVICLIVLVLSGGVLGAGRFIMGSWEPPVPSMAKQEAPVPYVPPERDANVQTLVKALQSPAAHGHPELSDSLRDVQIAAIVANIWGESKAGFTVTEGHAHDGESNAAIDAWTKTGAYGIGIMQWTHNPGRAGDLIALAEQLNANWYDVEPQVELTLTELSSTQSWRLKGTDFWSTSDVRTATDVFLRKFEAPADPDGVQASREYAATRILTYIRNGNG